MASFTTRDDAEAFKRPLSPAQIPQFHIIDKGTKGKDFIEDFEKFNQ